MDQAVNRAATKNADANQGAPKAAEPDVLAQLAAGQALEVDPDILAKYRELGLPEDKDLTDVVIALAGRVVALETQLAALQRATAHITSIQPIKG